MNTYTYLNTSCCKYGAPQDIFKYSYYVLAWYTSHVALLVAIPCVVIPHVVAPRMPRSMTISYTSGHYVYLASNCVRAGHKQLNQLLTYKIQSITVKGALVENA